MSVHRIFLSTLGGKLSRRLVRVLTVVVLGLGIAGSAGAAWAYFTGQATGTAGASTGSLSSPPGASATSSAPNVTVKWNAAFISGSSTFAQSYEVDRYNGSGTDLGPACGGGSIASSTGSPNGGGRFQCTDSPSSGGSYKYKITAIYNSWTATSDFSNLASLAFGAPTKLVITTQPSATDASGAALAQQPVVKVEDSGGNVVTSDSSTVTTNFTSGGVSLTNPTKAAVSGVATFSGLALNALAGPYTLTFSDGGLSTATSNTITVSTGAATKLVITTQPSATDASGAALAQQPVVKVEDSGGNVVTSVNSGTASATIASGSGGSIAAGGTSGTFASGVATFSGLALNGVKDRKSTRLNCS